MTKNKVQTISCNLSKCNSDYFNKQASNLKLAKNLKEEIILRKAELNKLPEQFMALLRMKERETSDSLSVAVLYGLEEGYIDVYLSDKGSYCFLIKLPEIAEEDISVIEERLSSKPFGKNDFVLHCLESNHAVICREEGETSYVALIKLVIGQDGSVITEDLS